MSPENIVCNFNFSIYKTLLMISAGTEHFKQFPDFVIVKVTPQSGTARNHYIVGIVELKKGPSFGDADRRQMDRYMTQAVQLPNCVNPLYGFLVAGMVVKKFVAQRMSNQVDDVNAQEVVNGVSQLSRREDAFFKDLCRISAAHWNYQASPVSSVHPH